MLSSSLRQEEEQELIISLIGSVYLYGKSVERNVNDLKETRDGPSTQHSRNGSGCGLSSAATRLAIQSREAKS